MKKVVLKLNKAEARLMAENLQYLIDNPKSVTMLPETQQEKVEYVVERTLDGLMVLLWQKYYTKLLSVEQNSTAKLILSEPFALAYKLKAFDVPKFHSIDHKLLAEQVYQLIDQAI